MDRLASLRLRLPVGYTFAPSDEEFVGFYLKRKALARRPGQEVVPEFDVFKAVPKKLPSGGRIFLGNKFFFMDLKDSVFESDDKRKAGSGYWKTAGQVKDIGRNGKLIGKRKRLVFWRRGKGDTFIRTRWIMYEFRLFVTAGHPTHQISSWAGYKIFLRKARKNRKNKQSERAEACDSHIDTEEEDEGNMEVVDDDDDVEQRSVMNFAAESGSNTGPPSPTTSDSFTSQ